jgi:predicted RNA-binding protein with TRAM domain
MADEDFDDDFDQFDDDLDDENQEEVEFDDDEGTFEEESNDDFDDDFEQDTSDDSDDEGFDKPVAEGDTVELEIEDLGSKGDGIARVEGFVIFVPGGEVGESYDVEITSVGRKFAFGEIA